MNWYRETVKLGTRLSQMPLVEDTACGAVRD
jgi:hypothetical protein